MHCSDCTASEVRSESIQRLKLIFHCFVLQYLACHPLFPRGLHPTPRHGPSPSASSASRQHWAHPWTTGTIWTVGYPLHPHPFARAKASVSVQRGHALIQQLPSGRSGLQPLTLRLQPCISVAFADYHYTRAKQVVHAESL